MEISHYVSLLFITILVVVEAQQVFKNDAQLMVLDNKYKNSEPVNLENIIL